MRARSSSPSFLIFSVLLPVQVVVDFDAGRVGLEFLGRQNHDTAVAAAEIEHLFAGFQTAELQHALSHTLRRRVIRREFIGLFLPEQAQGSNDVRKNLRSMPIKNTAFTAPCKSAYGCFADLGLRDTARPDRR